MLTQITKTQLGSVYDKLDYLQEKDFNFIDTDSII